MLRMSFVLRCLVSVYEWMISVIVNKYIHPITVVVLDNYKLNSFSFVNVFRLSVYITW